MSVFLKSSLWSFLQHNPGDSEPDSDRIEICGSLWIKRKNKWKKTIVDTTSQHPHFSIRVQQTLQRGWHLRPDPPEREKKKTKKRALAVICQQDLSHYSLQLIASLSSQPLPGSVSAADCNTRSGLKAVTQISAWPLGRKGCFSPSLQQWSLVPVHFYPCENQSKMRIYGPGSDPVF